MGAGQGPGCCQGRRGLPQRGNRREWIAHEPAERDAVAPGGEQVLGFPEASELGEGVRASGRQQWSFTDKTGSEDSKAFIRRGPSSMPCPLGEFGISPNPSPLWRGGDDHTTSSPSEVPCGLCRPRLRNCPGGGNGQWEEQVLLRRHLGRGVEPVPLVRNFPGADGGYPMKMCLLRALVISLSPSLPLVRSATSVPCAPGSAFAIITLGCLRDLDGANVCRSRHPGSAQETNNFLVFPAVSCCLNQDCLLQGPSGNCMQAQSAMDTGSLQ